MKDALQDLEALRVKAKDMVKLASELNEKLTIASTSRSSRNSSEPEEATFILSSLSQLGLQMSNTPVTLDMMKDERKWFEELARELAGVLQGTTKAGIMKERGIIALDEVWGSWNRARGVGTCVVLSNRYNICSYDSPFVYNSSYSTVDISPSNTPPSCLYYGSCHSTSCFPIWFERSSYPALHASRFFRTDIQLSGIAWPKNDNGNSCGGKSDGKSCV
jgi:hypothetical protein